VTLKGWKKKSKKDAYIKKGRKGGRGKCSNARNATQIEAGWKEGREGPSLGKGGSTADLSGGRK